MATTFGFLITFLVRFLDPREDFEFLDRFEDLERRLTDDALDNDEIDPPLDLELFELREPREETDPPRDRERVKERPRFLGLEALEDDLEDTLPDLPRLELRPRLALLPRNAGVDACLINDLGITDGLVVAVTNGFFKMLLVCCLP